MADFKVNFSDINKGISEMNTKLQTAILLLAQTQASNLQSDAQEQAKWTDRTGAARQRLKGTVVVSPSTVRIQLSHGVDYGMWLELANEKKYAIVEPLIRLNAPYMIQDYEHLLDKIGEKNNGIE